MDFEWSDHSPSYKWASPNQLKTLRTKTEVYLRKENPPKKGEHLPVALRIRAQGHSINSEFPACQSALQISSLPTPTLAWANSLKWVTGSLSIYVSYSVSLENPDWYKGRPQRQPLPGTYPNSRILEGKQGFSMNHTDCTDSLGTDNHSSQLMVGTAPAPTQNIHSQMPDRGQPGEQAFLRTSSQICSVNPFLCGK